MTDETRFSATRGELFAAMSKAQAAITGAVKDSSNPFFKSKYADLAACLEAVRKPLADNGLCVVQTTTNEGGAVTVVTTLGHSSGEWMEGRLTMTPEKAGPQALGACITYARRYALAAVTGLAQIDDDAESAMERGKKKEQPEEDLAIWMEAELTAKKGMDALHKWWEALSKEKRAALAADGARWERAKSMAADFDAAKEAA